MQATIHPPESGDNCEFCFGIGLPFGNVPTPDYMAISITEIQKGSAWVPGFGELANGAFKLLQLFPCQYRASVDLFHVNLTWSATNTLVTVDWNGIFQFFQNSSDPCQVTLANSKTNPAADFFGGSMTLLF